MDACRIGWLAIVMITAAGFGSARAQQTPDASSTKAYVTRQELTEMLAGLEEIAASDAYSSAEREQSQLEADLVRERLENGDFKAGDRIFVRVEAEAALTDTFTVREGPLLALPDLGDVPLAGVLRAELDAHLTAFVGQFIRNPTVQARSLMPLTVIGGVNAPGFYTVPTDGLLTDVLTVAGGPIATASINQIFVEREGQVLYDPASVARAIVEGRTVDQLSLRPGDQIVVPVREPAGGGALRVLAIVAAIVAIPVAVIAVLR